MDKRPLLLRVTNREGIVFEGQVENLSSVNDKGKFDVLSHHANFISLIGDYLIIRTLDKKEQQINIDGGVMKVVGNQIDVFLGVKERTPEPATTI